jgi:hypothetical protein
VPSILGTRLAGFAAESWYYVLAALSSLLVAALVIRGHTLMAVAVSVTPLAVWLLTRHALPFVALGASLPALMSISGQAGGVHVALSDILLLVLMGLIVANGVVSGQLPSVGALRPVAWVALPYSMFVLALLVFHPGLAGAAQSLQRYELFVFPLVIGAVAAFECVHLHLLRGYVVATTVLALLWPFDQFGMQKNPVGQLFTNAILLLVALPALRRLLPCMVALVPALLYTQSRGAIAAGAIGLAVIIAYQRFDARPIVTRVVPLVLVAIGAFALMPASLRDRVTTFSPGVNSPAAYSLHIRQGLSRDARQIIAEHPWVGVGVGNYQRADSASRAPTDDPHQVLLLQAAEGGYGFAAVFVLLVGGAALVLLTRLRQVALAPAAAAVLISTAAHGLVDVYWVRGTPVLGWLLLGMACGEFARRAQRTAPR